MKKFLFISGIAFSIAFATVIGFRMSADAMAVIVGIVCGVLASIPTSAILIWVLRQRDRQLELQMNQGRYGGAFPPVVVVNGQGTNGYGSPYGLPALTAATSAMPRDFKVIGQENTESVGDILPSIWE